MKRQRGGPSTYQDEFEVEREEAPNKKTSAFTKHHYKSNDLEDDSDIDALNDDSLLESASDGEDLSDSDGSGNSSSEDDSDEDQADDIPLGQLVKLKADGTTSATVLKARARALSKSQKSFKRESKHRPAEMSSKKPVPVLRDVFQTGKKEVRDPRFESISGGKVSDERFKKRYAFLYDEKLPAERTELKESLKKVKSEAKREQLKARLSTVTQQIRMEEQRRKKAASEKALKEKEREAVKAGKNPFYLKKSEKKKLELVGKYEELKRTGQLETYMDKRRKRNAAKDHRYLPMGRRGE